MKEVTEQIFIFTLGCIVCTMLILACSGDNRTVHRIKEIAHGHIVWNGTTTKRSHKEMFVNDTGNAHSLKRPEVNKVLKDAPDFIVIGVQKGGTEQEYQHRPRPRSSLLLGHWSQMSTEPDMSSFCPGQSAFYIDYIGTLSKGVSSVENVEICAGHSGGDFILPLYGVSATPGCDTNTQQTKYKLIFSPYAKSRENKSTPVIKEQQVYPPSADTVQQQFDSLFSKPKRSVHIIGDSHQRYMYMGLVDLQNHNCSNLYLNPIYLKKHHLSKQNIEKWFSAGPRAIHVMTNNLGLSKYNLPEKRFNQSIYEKIEFLSTCPGCTIVMNVGIHDMTSHTKKTYLAQHPNTEPHMVFEILEKEFYENVKQLLLHVVQLGMKDRFVWVSGTPYVESDTNWHGEGANKMVPAIRSTRSLSRWYRTFLFTKQLCDELGILFVDIFHPISGPGFETLRIPRDVHKKRYVNRAKAALLLREMTRHLS